MTDVKKELKAGRGKKKKTLEKMSGRILFSGQRGKRLGSTSTRLCRQGDLHLQKRKKNAGMGSIRTTLLKKATIELLSLKIKNSTLTDFQKGARPNALREGR